MGIKAQEREKDEKDHNGIREFRISDLVQL